MAATILVALLDVLDAALFDPRRKCAVFFAGERYVEFDPRRGAAQPARLGVDGWTELPGELRSGIDAALYVPDDELAYLFRGPWFVAYGRSGIVALPDGRTLRRLGRDGWQRLPFHDRIDTAFYDRARATTLFVRGTRYVEYETGRTGELEAAFDALLDYPPNECVYAFRGREYVRWDPERRAIAGAPMRIGSPYGRGLATGRGGGWLGLSHVIAGPLVGATATIWLWMIDRTSADRVRLFAGGAELTATRELAGDAGLRRALDGVYPGSEIVVLSLRDLAPARAYEIELRLDDVELDRIELRTAAAPAERGTMELVVGSCVDTVAHRDVPAFERMAERRADAAILLGDNCYYVNALGSSSDSIWKGGWFRADWDDPRRMLLRQLAARNHPQLAALARTTSVHATWDDHDFGYNNAGGHDRTRWAGREISASIHRAMWGAPYVHERAIYYAFRHGPVEVFVTDSRYDKDLAARTMLGPTQLAWLLDSLAASDAPVKIIALSSQLLYRRRSESFVMDAPGEREAILEALGLAAQPPAIRGRVLIVSGDVHYSELARAPTTGTPHVLELTSSGLRTGEDDDPLTEWEPGARLWVVQADSFAVIRVEVHGWRGETVDGTITVEARDDRGELLVAAVTRAGPSGISRRRT